MATVRFSKKIRDAILENARIVFNNTHTVAKDTRPDHAWSEYIYNTLFGEHVAALNAVPTMFFKQVSSIEVEKVGDAYCNLSFDMPTARPWPMQFPDTEYANQERLYCDSIALKHHPVWNELLTEVKAWRDRVKIVEANRAVFIEQVDKIIDAHTTLSSALKMWPPLWDLVPDEYKERHRREKKEVDVDLNSMTTVIVLNRITN